MRRFLISITLILGVYSQSMGQFASSSVLKEGEWIKLGILKTGVYRLDAAYLQSIGLNTSSINPQNIQIYGNGGGMLPQANSDFRHDDLVQNRIEVVGEADGSFDNGDFVLFYAQGPHKFFWDSESQLYRHELNLYSDTNYYYIHVGNQAGLRVEDQTNPSSATFTAGATRNHLFHELEEDNEIFSGRYWLGEDFNEFNAIQTFAFYVPDAAPQGKINITVEVAAADIQPTSFDLLVNNEVQSNINIPQVVLNSETSSQYRLTSRTVQVDGTNVSNDSLFVTLRYNFSSDNRGQGWLSYIEIDYDQQANLSSNQQVHLALADGTGAGEVANIVVDGVNSDTKIWNISNPLLPVNIPFNESGGQASINVLAEDLQDIFAFRGNYLQPVSYENVPNQDLHGQDPAQYLMIAPAQFMDEAQRLADFHRNHYGRTVAIATPEQIYNEFSSGKQDVSAIRDYIRMHYIRGLEVNLGHVLLFGDGSFIYKYINENDNNLTNFIPTYQSRNSWKPDVSFTADDFYVMLEEDEGYWGEGTKYLGDNVLQRHDLDVAIGRLPIETKEEAKEIVDKIIRYVTNPDGGDFGNWRNKIVLIADHKDQDGSIHARQANGYSPLIEEANPCYNVEKVYMDNYNMIITAGEKEFPEGRQAILDAFDEGSLIVNYTGHGGYNSWSDARIFLNSDLPNIKNNGRFPVVMTATCTYGRFDDPFQRSGAELLMMMPETGAIAMFTTVRLVYSGPNATLNRIFYGHVFDYDEIAGRMPTMGEVFVNTKNETYTLSNLNTRAFTLLGDPGIIMNYPKLNAVITNINDKPVDPSNPDSLRSLGKVSITGQMEDLEGNFVENFNGSMDVTVFDKPSQFTTNRAPYTFSTQINRIFNGAATVENGRFNFDFVVPIDISYEEGRGKISLYSSGTETDGAGCLTDLFVAGTDPNAEIDNKGPEVRLFINDSTWKNGGITSANPFLYALVFDENGINTVGTGIGHEISAFLDDEQEEVIILNDFYTAFPNSYQKGSVRYQLTELENGPHKLKIRVWDVANNSSEAETEFIVADNSEMVLDQIFGVPNPSKVGEGTTFWLQHNLDGKEIKVEIDVINLAGVKIADLESQFVAQGNNYTELSWDGRSEYGTAVAEGMYVFYVRITDVSTGETVEDAEKLVLIR
ncbi:MAG: type IX secretion system sortase PorU [Bacteroidia bacterium]|nr:type IX secretion system sortase PorU [Bacteroidia bacterium]